MIPTMILVGLVVGPVALERRSRGVGLAVAAVLCVAWGLVVWSGADASLVGATALGLANVLVGATVAILVALALRTVRRLVLHI